MRAGRFLGATCAALAAAALAAPPTPALGKGLGGDNRLGLVDEEPAPKSPSFELHGYLRFRGDLFHNFALGDPATGTLPKLTRFVTPMGEQSPNRNIPGLSASQATETAAGSNTLATAGLRLRLEPTLSITEDIRIKAQLDALDNLVLGSTPDGFPYPSGFAPIAAFTSGAVPPSDGTNALADSLRVKRAWGEVGTSFGLMAFGRMPAHWGMGLYQNDGRCTDCDYGTTWDRVLFVSKVAGVHVGAFIDFASEGVTSDLLELARRTTRPTSLGLPGAMIDRYQGRPFDVDQRDDVNQYGLALVRHDSPTEIKEKLLDGETVANYGLLILFRNQGWTTENRAYATSQSPFQGRPDQPDLSRTPLFERRGARLWVFDPWLKIMKGRTALELEGTFVLGSIDVIPGGGAADVYQYGAAARLTMDGFRGGDLGLGLEVGIASGGDGAGLGLRDGVAFSPTRIVGGSAVPIAPSSFKFNPDFQIDRILFRQIIGAVTDAWYAKATTRFALTDALSLHGALIYSNAVNTRQWPGDGLPEPSPGKGGGCGTCPLGLEANVDLVYRYQPGDRLYASIGYAALMPFTALRASTPLLSSFAQTLFTRIVIRY